MGKLYNNPRKRICYSARVLRHSAPKIMNIETKLHNNIKIQKAIQNEQREAACAFYSSVGYNVPIEPNNRIVIALDENKKVVGIVRVCEEEGALVLRGMQVSDSYQRRGIGSLLLKDLSSVIGQRECWCLPYPHLEKFYSQIGFAKADSRQVPDFLQERLSKYHSLGWNNIVMKREESYNVKY